MIESTPHSPPQNTLPIPQSLPPTTATLFFAEDLVASGDRVGLVIATHVEEGNTSFI